MILEKRIAPRGAVFAAAIFAVFFLCGGAACAESAVRKVDFYPAGAKFAFEVESDGVFEFDMPGAFDENSVRCMTIEHLSSLKVERVAVKNETPAELIPYEKKVDDASKALSMLEGRQKSIVSTLEFLSSFGRGAVGEAGFVGEGLIDYVRSSHALRLELEAELSNIGFDIEKARKALEEARQEYEDVKARLEREKGAVPGKAVRVSGATDGPSVLTFEAFTGMAGWNVVYEMNMDSEKGAVNAKMNAAAWQHTGLGVEGEFTFNTRQPSYSIFPPEVSPLTVGLRQDSSTVSYRMAAPGVSAVVPGYTFAVDKADALSEYAPPTPNAISTLANVSVTGQGKIDGDGSGVRVKLGDFELECAPLLVSIPEQNSESWIVASIDVIPESFLPGSAELSVDNSSTGSTSIGESAASAKIPFGMASRVRSKKEPYIRETGSSWIGTGTLNDGYIIEVTNGMDSEREVTVMDRVPFPTIDKVTVDVKKIEPEPYERDKDNRLTWKIILKPGETKKITVEYAIKYPGGETLEYR
ncbi:MAG: DUF4139 domain-containing protein [Synergistaceae bacterium]|nr:DUF4139 domain-containing protein [Synergistaceae bacterium]